MLDEFFEQLKNSYLIPVWGLGECIVDHAHSVRSPGPFVMFFLAFYHGTLMFLALEILEYLTGWSFL